MIGNCQRRPSSLLYQQTCSLRCFSLRHFLSWDPCIEAVAALFALDIIPAVVVPAPDKGPAPAWPPKWPPWPPECPLPNEATSIRVAPASSTEEAELAPIPDGGPEPDEAAWLSDARRRPVPRFNCCCWWTTTCCWGGNCCPGWCCDWGCCGTPCKKWPRKMGGWKERLPDKKSLPRKGDVGKF